MAIDETPSFGYLADRVESAEQLTSEELCSVHASLEVYRIKAENDRAREAAAQLLGRISFELDARDGWDKSEAAAATHQEIDVYLEALLYAQ